MTAIGFVKCIGQTMILHQVQRTVFAQRVEQIAIVFIHRTGLMEGDCEQHAAGNEKRVQVTPDHQISPVDII